MTKNTEISEEYIEKVKNAVHDGTFFRDSMQWYIFQYIRPAVDRNLMVIFSLIGSLCVYYLYDIIKSSFPLVREVPVIMREHDTSLFRPIIKKLKDPKDKNAFNSDESVVKYLLSNYVKEREAFDFSDSNIKSVNKKFNIIKNNSSYLEYRNFRSQMSRSNPASPINFFGQDVRKSVEILSFKFAKAKPKNKLDTVKIYFSPRLSNAAEVRLKSTLVSTDKDGKKTKQSKKYLAKISYDFSGLNRDAKPGSLNFSVKKYDLFEIK